MIKGIVLAAGMGRRIGTAKALISLAGETLHQRALRAFHDAGLDVVLVLNPLVNEEIPPPRPWEHRVLNPDPDQEGGMFASVRLGVAKVRALGGEAAILLPVDHPLVTPEDIRSVTEALVEGAQIAVATHGGRRGHPIGIGRGVMDEITSGPVALTLRDVVRRDRGRVREVPASEGVLAGINTREDLERVSNRTFR